MLMILVHVGKWAQNTAVLLCTSGFALFRDAKLHAFLFNSAKIQACVQRGEIQKFHGQDPLFSGTFKVALS